MNEHESNLETINSLKNILYSFLEECQWNFHDETVVSINRAIDEYIVAYIRSLSA
ncbi:hypothetical protein HNQ80_000829 [Anaerosolibacter carboniphilus]|uniref:Spo0E like sporulation regulatory protein n=1 Tax=Anaerosolibacter carboniphilus TaxID=1417629 RepID=A0A841KMT5_9FIRM|nr:hypothetical protein [Anaerosolibacter carboniphilus]MBB6214746.1 hypothetical protein [Anaerosolibacter carboniphilus]